jgi:hypothetical protein
MRTQTLCHRIEKKINPKFVWLKVASINISRSTVPDCAPFLMVPFLARLAPGGFRGEDFLEINQSETRMACGGHVC